MSKIAVLSGDGIGPEVMEQALKVLKRVDEIFNLDLEYIHGDIGGAGIDRHGKALPDETLEICKNSAAILLGSVGGPKWDNLPPEERPERAALLPLRAIFNLFCNLRPAKLYPQLVNSSPLREDIAMKGFDILCVRELTGGIYFGEPRGREIDDKKSERAFDTLVYRDHEIERIAKFAVKAAKKRRSIIHSVDKANVLTSMVLWREIATKVISASPEIKLEHIYVDNAAMQLIKDPAQFDVLLCGNMFGDILSDECAILTGSLGLLPSASINENDFGLYEPAGGSAPDIAGENVANPLAQILSSALLLRYSLKNEEAAKKIELAIEKVLDAGFRTRDIATGKKGEVILSTTEMGDEVVKCL